MVTTDPNKVSTITLKIDAGPQAGLALDHKPGIREETVLAAAPGSTHGPIGKFPYCRSSSLSDSMPPCRTSISSATKSLGLPVTMPTFAEGHLRHQARICAASRVASLNPCAVLGCFPARSQSGLAQVHFPSSYAVEREYKPPATGSSQSGCEPWILFHENHAMVDVFTCRSPNNWDSNLYRICNSFGLPGILIRPSL